jgi:LysM repeat protein
MFRSRFFSGRMSRYGLIAILALTLVLAALPTAAMAAPAYGDWGYCKNVHVVHRGEILSKIARYYAVNVFDLADINGISNPNQIYPGQKLCIPPASSGGHKGGYDDHKDGYGGHHSSVGCSKYHHVRKGDTLSEIAKWYHVNLWALAKLNNIDDPNIIIKGSKICIPSAYEGVSYGHDGYGHDGYGHDGYYDKGGYGHDGYYDKPDHGCGSCGYYNKPDYGYDG